MAVCRQLVDKIFARLWWWFLFRKESFEHDGGAADTAGVRGVLDTSCRGVWRVVGSWWSQVSAGVDRGQLGATSGRRLSHGSHYVHEKLVYSVIKRRRHLAVATPSTTHVATSCNNSPSSFSSWKPRTIFSLASWKMTVKNIYAIMIFTAQRHINRGNSVCLSVTFTQALNWLNISINFLPSSLCVFIVNIGLYSDGVPSMAASSIHSVEYEKFPFFTKYIS